MLYYLTNFDNKFEMACKFNRDNCSWNKFFAKLKKLTFYGFDKIMLPSNGSGWQRLFGE